MSESVVDLEIRVTRAEVYCNLGYGMRGSPSDRIAARLDRLWPGAIRRLRPRGVWAVLGHQQAAATRMPEPPPFAGIGLVTVGDELETEVDRLNQSGLLVDALLMDAIGSTGAEAAAEALDQIVGEGADAQGLHAGMRFSPGYGGWDTRHQRELLAHLPTARLGVTLTDGMMMMPRKSVSFVVPYLDEPPRSGRKRHGCAKCTNRETCTFRKD